MNHSYDSNDENWRYDWWNVTIPSSGYYFLVYTFSATEQIVHENGLGIDNILMTIMRLIGIVLYTTVITLTTPPTEITYGLQKVFSPLNLIGLPVNKISLSISLALRFIPTIIDQGNKILKSQE